MYEIKLIIGSIMTILIKYFCANENLMHIWSFLINCCNSYRNANGWFINSGICDIPLNLLN